VENHRIGVTNDIITTLMRVVRFKSLLFRPEVIRRPPMWKKNPKIVACKIKINKIYKSFNDHTQLVV
jgi:hypothetical protein